MQKAKRIAEYEKMGLGLFIHWGLYALLQQGEWTEFIHQIPQKEYEKLINKFDAKNFNPHLIAKLAKDMGCKYIVLTTKHHEGFFLYDTHGLSNFDAPHSGAKRDLIKEFVAACNDEGIKPFFYMATYDWHNPDYRNNFNRYLEYLRQSVEILCKNYGPIGGLWFDGNWNKKNADWKLDELYGTIRKYQPQAMIINNTGLKNAGTIVNPEIDAVTYERGLPGTVNHGQPGGKYVAGEISVTLNQHWGNAKMDLDYKSPAEIIETIVHAKKIGANVLVNIGLNPDGSIKNIDRDYMALIGKWTHLYREAFYNGSQKSCPSASNPKDFSIKVGQNYYFFVHDLKVTGNSNVVLGGEGVNPKSFLNIDQPLKSLAWIDNNEDLTFTQDQKKGILTFDATGYRYGSDYVVRVAKGTIR